MWLVVLPDWQMHVRQHLEMSMTSAVVAAVNAVKTKNDYLTIPRRKGPLTVKFRVDAS